MCGVRMENRNKKFVLNSSTSLLQQIVTLICGLILPQIILKTFGSSVNGTMASITQFLSFITLLQGGVGTVAKLAYYKPLAKKDNEGLSVAYKTVSSFYKKFSIIFSVYLILLSVLFPMIIDTGFNFGYVALLVLILGLASVFEYFFGQASQMLLAAAQKNYIFSIVQIICTILSTILGVVLIKCGGSVHLVKFVSALVFTVRPLFLYCYVKKHYSIKKQEKKDNSVLGQRRSALVRHIAFYIHTSTDVFVLTIFTNILLVSVYSVHRYVIGSVSTLVTSILGNTEAVFGDMFARNEKETMKRQIPVYDLLTKIISCTCFTTCMILIAPFLKLYTKGVTDVEYSQPIFAFILCMAEMVYCMSITYQNVYIAAGHIKKTEWIAITEALINIGLSCLLVNFWGLLGVAIGTLTAMIFKTVANIIYMKKNVFNMSGVFIIKSNLINLLVCVTLFLGFRMMNFSLDNYWIFFGYALIVFFAVLVVFLSINLLIFRKETKAVIEILKKKFIKKE